jgi:cation:H+ antiporter
VTTFLWLGAVVAAVGLIVVGAESFAEHLAGASVRLGASTFALALLLAGAEPEELATVVVAARRDLPAIALGDVIGANLTACLVALGVGAVLAPLPFGPRVRRYALLGLPLGVMAVAVAWDGRVARPEGALLVLLYAAYVATIWRAEREPPALGEVGELDEAREAAHDGPRRRRVGRELAWVLFGVVAMAAGASVLVEAVRRLSGIEETQARLSYTLVGFATGFELVVLAWSAARRGVGEAAVAGVVGSFAYNSTMTLGAGALARPLRLTDADLLRIPWLAMVAALVLVVALAWGRDHLDRPRGVALLAAYPVVIGALLIR